MSRVDDMYKGAKEMYAEIGVDTEKALHTLKTTPISLHCWQLDDLTGFENFDSVLSGGIQATGNYPGKPRTIEEYMKNLDQVISFIPGALKIALHSVYPVFNKKVDRNRLEPKHFEFWVDYAKKRNIGLDFNPTYFSHPMAASGMTLSSSDETVRQYWIEHGKACRKIGEYFGKELGEVCITNHWIGDGSKDYRIDKIGPRERLADSLNQIFKEQINPKYNIDSVESKLFGIGVESYTVGSHEFYTNYAMTHNNCIICLDTGHFHPTELVSDKISAYLCFNKEIMLHVSRPVRWDSDHVVMLDDETKAIMQEIVRSNGLPKVHIGSDYFDASINRVAASIIGIRNIKKALLFALLQPNSKLLEVEKCENYTKRLAILEESKSMPFGLVWDMFCERENVPCGNWIEKI